jgi:DNA-binding SARP family transcriptional activator
MWVGLLGPLLARYDGADLPVGSGRQRVVLAALALRPGQVVSVAGLCGVLWDDASAPAAAVTARSYVKRLRQALGPVAGARVVTRAPGYLLEARPDEVDALVFGRLCEASAAAAQTADWRRAASLLDEALGLWRGAPLADVRSEALHREWMPRLEQLRLQAVQQRIDALLNLGEHAELIPELHALVAEHPLHEALHGQLMTALYRAGRQADALAAYQRARRTLADELGVDPGPHLRDLHQRILTGDPGLITVPAALAGGNGAAARGKGHVSRAGGNGVPRTQVLRPWQSAANRPSGHPAAAGTVIPRQLPAGVPGFVARQAELELLSGALAKPDDGSGPVISVVRGMAGVGKTALTVHWAHQVADRFPDGQLYADLRGFAPSAEPAEPAEITQRFLDALGVPVGQSPASSQAQAGLYRSVLAGRRMLIVLDNARDEEQVRPLLPGSPGCLVVVTSRARLTGLAAAEGAQLVNLDVLADADARQLLTRRIGPGRAAAEPGVVAELAVLCGGLPLALAIVAARAADRPGFPLAALAAELAAQRLDALEAGDMASSVRAVLSWSYRQLSPAAARLFRLLTLHPGPDISMPAAASLAATGPAETRVLLADLSRAHMVTEHQRGRFTLHELLRGYAAEQARLCDGETDRREATGRVLDHYVHTAYAGTFQLQPSHVLFTPTPSRAGTSPEQIADQQHALDWFKAEHEVLISAVDLADSMGFDACAWQLAWAIADPLLRRHWHQCLGVQRIALAAATRDGDLAGQAAARGHIGWACIRLADYTEAGAQLTARLQLHQRMGDRRGEAGTHQALAQVSLCQGREGDALSHAGQALAVFRSVADQGGEAAVLNDLGCYHVTLGDYQRAQGLCQQALALARELGNQHIEADTWDSLGEAEHHLGHFSEAAACYWVAIDLFRQFGDSFFEAGTLARLGDSRAAAGDAREAHESWQRALEIFDLLQHPDAAKLRAKLGQDGPAQDG